MDISKAKQLKQGDIVHYPPDSGSPRGVATVKQDCSDHSVHKNIRDTEYIWVCTDYGVWPSNRL